MLSAIRIEIVRRRISYVAARIIRLNGNIVADLVLVWITFEWIKRVADSYVRRPGNTGIRAVRIK